MIFSSNEYNLPDVTNRLMVLAGLSITFGHVPFWFVACQFQLQPIIYPFARLLTEILLNQLERKRQQIKVRKCAVTVSIKCINIS